MKKILSIIILVLFFTFNGCGDDMNSVDNYDDDFKKFITEKLKDAEKDTKKNGSE